MSEVKACTRVAIIGAGPAGLSTGAALRARGVDSVLLDAGEQVGDSWRQRYDRLHLHTHRRWSGLAERRVPRTYPAYLSKDEYADWLEGYARHFNLDVRLGCPVRRVRREDGSWSVETDLGTWNAEAVVVCSGLYRRPHPPDVAGVAGYRGAVVHAARFRSADDYDGSRVLVVGLGNSGAEIAAELAASDRWQVAASVRTSPPIRRRDVAGIPSQLLGIILSGMPRRVASAIDASAARFAPDPRQWGLGTAGWKPFLERRPPVIDAGLVEQLRAGRVKVLPPLTALTTDTVRLADGSERAFDLVVLATGYTTGLEELIDPAHLAADGTPYRGSGGRTPDADGLYFVGFDPTLRGQLYEIRRRSLQVADDIARTVTNAAHPASGSQPANA